MNKFWRWWPILVILALSCKVPTLEVPVVLKIMTAATEDHTLVRYGDYEMNYLIEADKVHMITIPRGLSGDITFCHGTVPGYTLEQGKYYTMIFSYDHIFGYWCRIMENE